jgi:hypothetical protein
MESKMSRAALMASAAALIGLTVLANDHGRSQAALMSAPQTDADHNLLDMKALAEQGERLKADTEAALKAFDEMQGLLEASSQDAQKARQNVDDMIKLLRAAADRLGPDGAYVKTLKQQQEFLRALAAEAMASPNTGDHLYGDQLASQATTIGSLREEASDLAAKLTAQIDRLQRSASQIAYAAVVKHTDDFIKLARQYLDGARRLLLGTAELATKAEKIVAPTVPTQ